MAILLASLPLAARLLLGSWEFPEALGVACLCGFAGAYLHLVSRRRRRAVPDPASTLEDAFEMAQAGQIDEAIALLTREIRRTPKLWQAYQYRGQLHLAKGEAGPALSDIDEAIRLAPGETDLYLLRDAASAPPPSAAPDALVPPPADR